jgi:hypothetical protein
MSSADEDTASAGPGKVYTTDALDLLASQPVAGRATTMCRQIGFRPFLDEVIVAF